ncbi:MAG: dihydropteroate synthase, partial [Planctomycetales bacterium]|nr:dihydropteroate synthase [Planctomycetales bacterium]
MAAEHLHFVTGRLAEHALRDVVAPLAESVGFQYSIDVLPITVAALMTPQWIAPRLSVPTTATKVLIPGYCEGDLTELTAATCVPVERGPRDLRKLPSLFGHAKADSDYGAHQIEIVAEINHSPRLKLDEILAQAQSLAHAGADVIDIGCDPGDTWPGVAETVKAVKDLGLRVSIDSLNVQEISEAAKAGAELVLSVNASNRHAAADWGVEVVAIPDDPHELAGLDATVEHLATAGVRLRIDAILEPIGFGMAESLRRYLDVRRRYPDAEMLMGVGNLTELSDCDSAGINFLLLGFCEEVGIRSILTTQVIPWAQSSVAECDVARRLAHYAVRNRALPKHVDERLIMLRDADPMRHDAEMIERLAQEVKDHNYRLLVGPDGFHLVAAGIHLTNQDPFALFAELAAQGPKNLDASHAFYLGFELCKAQIAAALGKRYEQDEAL